VVSLLLFGGANIEATTKVRREMGLREEWEGWLNFTFSLNEPHKEVYEECVSFVVGMML